MLQTPKQRLQQSELEIDLFVSDLTHQEGEVLEELCLQVMACQMVFFLSRARLVGEASHFRLIFVALALGRLAASRA